MHNCYHFLMVKSLFFFVLAPPSWMDPPHVAGPRWRAPNWRQLQPILDWKNQNLGSDQLAIIIELDDGNI
jgi:hypothetical protein